MKDTHCNGVLIPQRMRKLPRFQGMPVPWTTWTHPLTRIPDFKINDEKRRRIVIRKRWCSLCGEAMNQKIAFIGGAGAIEHGQYFVDAGMHPTCAEFAWQVCPYIVYGRGHAKHIKEYPGAVIEVFREMPTEPVERMGMIVVSTYEIVQHEGNVFVQAGPRESVVWRKYEGREA